MTVRANWAREQSLRLVYLSPGYTPHDFRFLSGLAGEGHEVFHVRMTASAASETRPVPSGVKNAGRLTDRARVWQWEIPFLAQRLRHILEGIRPDLVHAGPIQQGAATAALTGFRPVVAMSWGSDLLRDGAAGIGRLVARYALLRASALVCDCQAVRAAAERLGFAAERITVFPWGTDPAHFHPGRGGRVRAELGWEDRIVLVSSRAWERIYGVLELVEAFIDVAHDLPQVRLLMLGKGSLEPVIVEKLRAAQMLDRVHFAGWVCYDRLPDYYGAADLYVSASHSDGSSVSLLEAMACGLPAIVSDIPGNREWVESGVNGWLFRKGSPADLAVAIRRAAQAQAEWPKMGERGRQQVLERADWSRNFPLLFDAYRTALTGGGSNA